MCNAYCLAHQIQTAVSDKTTSSLCMWLSFQLQQTLKSHPDKKKLFLALCSCCVLIMNVPLCREAPVFAKKTLKVFLHIFAGCLGALEWTLSEARHLRYGGRYICVDPVWRKMVRGAGERQRSTGRHFFFPLCLEKSLYIHKQSWRGNTSFPQVSDFTWSHDGTQALIAYRDGFVLVGSVSGQRHWSSEINLESQITCGIWTPDDQQVRIM